MTANPMRKIASFTVDHDTLVPGVYVSRIDGDAVTYDLRMKTPNGGDYLSPKALHTIEHLLATYVRSSDCSDAIIYVGPMGCRTGFYIVARDTLTQERLLELLREAFRFLAAFTGEIPGNQRKECGNYLEHDLADARREAAAYVSVLDGVTPDTMQYPS